MATLVLFSGDLVDPNGVPTIKNFTEEARIAADASDIVVFSRANETVVLKSAEASY